MFDILSKLSELAPDMVSRRPNGPPAQQLMPSQMAIGEMMQGAQEGLARPTRQEQYGTPMTMGRPTRGQEYGNATITSDGSPAPQRLAMPGPETKGFDSKGAAGALLNASMSMGGSDEEIKHASFDLPGAQSNGIRERTISGLRGYYGGGMLRPGQSGLVGDEVVQVDENGAKIIPVDGSANRDAEADTQGYFQANPMDSPMPDGVQQTVQGSPDARQLLSPVDQQMEDVRGQITAEEQKTTKSPWKDVGFGILQGLNNALNNRNDSIVGWNEFGEQKRTRPLKQKLGELQKQRAIDLDAEKDKANIGLTRAKPQMARDAAKAKVEAAKLAYDRRTEFFNKQQDVRSGEARYYTDENGNRWKEFLKPDSSGKLRPAEPVADPENPGQQDVDPNFRLFEVESPESGTKIRIKGRDLFAGESNIAGRNVAIGNQDIDDLNKWQGEIADNETKRRTIKSDIAGLDTKITQLKNANDVKRQEIAAEQEKRKTAKYAEDIKEIDDKIKRLEGEINTNDKDWRDREGEKAAKQKEASSIVDRPKPTPRNTITPPGVTGKPVPKSKDPEGLYQ